MMCPSPSQQIYITFIVLQCIFVTRAIRISNAVEQWGLFEYRALLDSSDPPPANLFTDVWFSANFIHTKSKKKIFVHGFYNGALEYVVRFSPSIIGKWTFFSDSNMESLRNKNGELECTPAMKGNHGPVNAANDGTRSFTSADGTPHFSVGTTSYAWIHMPDSIVNKTLKTLQNAKFNKIRMTVMPKWYPYSHNEPPLYPFEQVVRNVQKYSRWRNDNNTKYELFHGGDPQCVNGINDGFTVVCCPKNCSMCEAGPVWNQNSRPWWNDGHNNPCTLKKYCCASDISLMSRHCSENVAPCIMPALRQWDFTRFHIPFWKNLDQRVAQLQSLGIIADVILFHPYDYGHWGFDCMGFDVDNFYLRYVVARLAAYRTIWWSMANEWSDMLCKCKPGEIRSNCSQEYWDQLFNILREIDPYARERSIHNGELYYNHSREWITHISMQCSKAKCVDFAMNQWESKPIVMDEVRYEGNVSGFASLSGEKMTAYFWKFLAKGAYCGHSEAFLPENWTNVCTSHDSETQGNYGAWVSCSPVMWWNHGATFHGRSPLRLSWMVQELFTPLVGFPPSNFAILQSSIIRNGVYILSQTKQFYLIFWDEDIVQKDPPSITLILPPSIATSRDYRCVSIAYFNMTINTHFCPTERIPAGNFTYMPYATSIILVLTI